MRSTTPVSARVYRAISVAAVTLLGLTTACQDGPTAPAPASTKEVSAPQATIYPVLGATMTVAIRDINGVVIPEKLGIKIFLGGSVTDTVSVFDNTAADKDVSIGRFKITVPWHSSYKVCATGLSANYGVDYYLDACKTITTNATSFDAGSVVAHRRPKFLLQLRDGFGNTLTGAAAQFTYAPGQYSTFNDQFTPGVIVAVLPQPGTYPYCETKAPTGYAFTNPQCSSITIGWDTVWSHTLVHLPL